MDSHVNVITCLTESGRRGLTRGEAHRGEPKTTSVCDAGVHCPASRPSGAVVVQARASVELPTDLTAMTPQSYAMLEK